MTDVQRRSVFRVPVAEPGWLTAALFDDSGEQVGAVVLDLSRAGIGARLPAGMQVERGVRLRCRLSFDEALLDTEVTVRNCTPDDASTRLGMEFTALAPLQDSILSRAVFRLQRYLLRRQRNRMATRPGRFSR
ncbi:MAG: PilZ protein [Hydrocarboniphaga sp.]|uniref:flagellar brake protein n=1 Tax=Hydrocarboniphaga sp. TaxID=2033016 RepID=UPI002609660F|nr:PilZ domain-containing protein [Hydrocarboniphaga sp.]MDB5971916.1 PilZ protein [Hydrocarboniphaga sp.]